MRILKVSVIRNEFTRAGDALILLIVRMINPEPQDFYMSTTCGGTLTPPL